MHLSTNYLDVIEDGARRRTGRRSIVLNRDIRFTTYALESYLIAPWDPVIDDAMTVAAAIEFADRTVVRKAYEWARSFEVRVPVFDPKRWADAEVHDSLKDAVEFLTGDFWSFKFVQRRKQAIGKRDACLDLAGQTQSVIAYSDGMDSRAVAGLLGESAKDEVLLVRLGGAAPRERSKQRTPFTGIPFKVHTNTGASEPSARNRGFKFALMSGIAAFLSKAPEIIIPESGQGILGPVLVPVGHAYPDYRNHPRFTQRMQRFLRAIFGITVRFRSPRLWHTKGETLAEFAVQCPDADWHNTRSCWMGSNHSSVGGRRRQCGICAACLLRRMSVHAAGLAEPKDTYVWNRLDAARFAAGADPEFLRPDSPSKKEYAVAGALHWQNLADLAADDPSGAIVSQAAHLAPILDATIRESETKMRSLVNRHAAEWSAFLDHSGPSSFLKPWIEALA